MAPMRARPWLCRGLVLGLLAAPTAASGQATVVFDGSLGAAGAAPTEALEGGGVDYRIAHTRGQQVDAALFHSFAELSVNPGDAASFTGPDAIDQVFARVTGGNASQIDGLLRSEIPSADLWLLNPQGVLFGPGAQLDIDGSFHATTADELRFGPGQVFEARAGGALPTLVVAPPAAFGYLRDDPAGIVVEGVLEVDPGKTLSLVGGPLLLDGARLEAPGGRVNLVSAGSAGTVGLAALDAPEPLDTSSLAAMAPLEVVGGSRIDVSGTSPGTVLIRSGKLVVSGPGTEILAINEGTGPEGGRISIVATGPAEISDGAIVEVGTQSDGRGGDLDLVAPSLLIDRGRVASTVLPGAAGHGGTLDLDVAGTLTIQNWEPLAWARVRDGSEPRPVGLSVGTFGSGHGGEIVIHADTVILTNYGGLFASSVGGDVFEVPVDIATGDGGTIHVTANVLTLDRGGWIRAASLDGSEGDAGDVQLRLATLQMDGSLSEAERENTPFTTRSNATPLVLSSRIVATAIYGSQGDAGPLSIVAGESVTVSNGAQITVFTLSTGNAGTVLVDTDSLTLDGGSINAQGFGADAAGHAGSIRIVADSVELGVAQESSINGGSYNGSAGSGGTVEIDAGRLRVGPFGNINSALNSDSGGEHAGTVVIRAGSLTIDGGFISAAAEDTSTGDAGMVDLEVGTLRIDGGYITTNTSSGGRTGSIRIVATESVFVSNEGGARTSLTDILAGESELVGGIYSGSGVPPEQVLSPALGTGPEGSIRIEAPAITVTEGAIVGTPSLGPQDAGDIVLRGERITISDGGLVNSAAVFAGAGGKIDLAATQSITVAGRNRHGDAAGVGSATAGLGAAGSVSLRAPLIRIDDHGAIGTGSIPISLEEIGALPSGGAAGGILVEAGRLFVTGGAQIDSSSLTQGAAGDIRIRATESISISGADSRIATRAGGAGAGGNISLTAPEISITEGGEISAESAPGLGDVAASLEFLSAEDLISPPAEATGEGGSIRLETDSLELRQGSITALSTGSANAGSIEIVGAQRLALTDSAITTEATQGSGGNIAVETSELLHLVRSAITASVTSGSGGNITLGNPQLILLEEDSRIIAQAVEGSGGNILLGADVLIVSPDSLISASSELGVEGTVEIRAPDTDLSSELVSLPSTFLDAVGLMKERCAARQGGERAGSFVWTGRSGAPGSPDGPLPVYYDAPQPSPGVELAGLLVGASAEGEPLTLLVGCGAS